MSSPADHRAAFLANVLDHNASLISLIDTKAGLILGSVAVLLPLYALLDPGQLGPAARALLFAALAPFCTAAIFSFLTILPRITKRAAGETLIFYTSVATMGKGEYLRRVRDVTQDRIVEDYADNIHALAVIQDRKVRMLTRALRSMMASIIMVAAALLVHAGYGHAGGSW